MSLFDPFRTLRANVHVSLRRFNGTHSNKELAGGTGKETADVGVLYVPLQVQFVIDPHYRVSEPIAASDNRAVGHCKPFTIDFDAVVVTSDVPFNLL